MPVIALLTDFGPTSPYVGVMKGAILKTNPQARLIDLTHAVSPHNIEEGAFLLLGAVRYFAPKTVFVAVVDPGVGSARRALAIKTKHYYFVGPDNGILTVAARSDGIERAVALKNTRYFLSPVSRTFHGRDIFAPVAARLAGGLVMTRLGPEVGDFKQMVLPAFVADGDLLQARILYVDQFGNLVTNVGAGDLRRFIGERFRAVLNGKAVTRQYSFYQAAGQEPFFIEGSNGFLEISLKNRSAAEYFGVKYPWCGYTVRIRRAK